MGYFQQGFLFGDPVKLPGAGSEPKHSISVAWGLGWLPARLIQTAPELPNTMASAGAGCFKMSLIIVLNIASNALISALDCLFIWMIPHRSFTAAACWVVAPAPITAPIIRLEPFPGCSWSNPDEIPRAHPCGLLCGQTKRLFGFQ